MCKENKANPARIRDEATYPASENPGDRVCRLLVDLSFIPLQLNRFGEVVITFARAFKVRFGDEDDEDPNLPVRQYTAKIFLAIQTIGEGENDG